MVVVVCDCRLKDDVVPAGTASLDEPDSAPDVPVVPVDTVSLSELISGRADVSEIRETGTVVDKVSVYLVTVVAARRKLVDVPLFTLADVFVEISEDETEPPGTMTVGRISVEEA